MTLKEIEELAGHRKVSPWIVKLVGDAVKAEREACAKVCDNIHFTVDSGNNFAKRIRARGNQ